MTISDNLGVFNLATNKIFSIHVMHISVHFHFQRKRVVAKKIILNHVATTDQLADFF
ncbi:unnamed protein product, partial [Discosporangium mesarthrocarpum]